MRHNKIYQTLLAGITVLSSVSVIAGSLTGSAGFRTIKDVTVTENASLNYGTTIIPLSGKTCSMGAQFKAGSTTLALPTATSANLQLSGAGCDSTAYGTQGYFSISGAVGSSIKIRVDSSDPVTFPDYSFTPAIRYSSGIIGDNVTAGVFNSQIFPDTTTTVTLGDDTVVSDSGSDGKGTLLIGGALTIDSDLVYDTSYSLNYEIEVTY